MWERDVLPRRTGAYSQAWLDSLCASGEVVWVGTAPPAGGSTARRTPSGRVALYFREDAPTIGPPATGAPGRAGVSPPDAAEHELLRARLGQGPCFFTDLLAELDAPAEALRVALWDLVWAGEATNDAWAPLRAPHLTLARGERAVGARDVAAGRPSRSMVGRARFGAPRAGTHGRDGRLGAQVQGRWSLTEAIFRGAPPAPAERRRALCELLLERYGIVTREQVLAEGIRGGFATLYEAFADLETLGVCRRGYFIEGMGGAQFALPGAVERLRSLRSGSGSGSGSGERPRALVIAAADPAQPYGGALPWPKPQGMQRRPARVAGAYVVLVDDQPALYVERGGRGLLTLTDRPAQTLDGPGRAGAAESERVREALQALAEAVRAGRVGKLALERIDGQPAMASELVGALVELGFHSGPRKITLTA
jgi:ATP-dependent Lhr-like helicase